jgi:hypothetical protein
VQAASDGACSCRGDCWVRDHSDMRRCGGDVQMRNLKIDEPLLRFFDHDSWKKLGVDDALVRSRLLRRQLEVEVSIRVKSASLPRALALM